MTSTIAWALILWGGLKLLRDHPFDECFFFILRKLPTRARL
jgi:hypothetical protein